MPESHFSNKKELVTLYDQSSESEMEMTDSSKSGILTKKVTTAALLAALSVAITPVASFLPRYLWGIAYFDPVSIFWIVAFLIGGLEVGLLSTVVGTIALLPFDPTGIGPMFKIAATLPMILILWLGTRWKGQKLGGQYLEFPIPYFGLIIIGYIVRIMIMIPINLVLVSIFFPQIGVLDIVIVTIVFNALQSALESTISYNIVFSTRLFDQFGMW
jgi:hypothetical protein